MAIRAAQFQAVTKSWLTFTAGNSLFQLLFSPLDPELSRSLSLSTGMTMVCLRTISTSAKTREAVPESEKFTIVPSNSPVSESDVWFSSEPCMKVSEMRKATLSPVRVVIPHSQIEIVMLRRFLRLARRGPWEPGRNAAVRGNRLNFLNPEEIQTLSGLTDLYPVSKLGSGERGRTRRDCKNRSE